MAKTYSRRQLAEAIAATGVGAGDIVFSHGNIGFFGVPEEGRSPDVVFEVISGAFFDVLGPEGTLVVPTFTYSFSQNQPFDYDNTPSDCGVFTEMVRTSPDSLRSEDPNVSVCAIGAKAVELTRDVPENAYAPNSFFGRLLAANGVICNLNFDAGSTFVHYVERCLEVPYRFDKAFDGTFVRDGLETRRRSVIWVRHLHPGTVAQFESFSELAKDAGRFRTQRVGRGFVGAITASDTYELIESTLPARPWLLTAADKTGEVPSRLRTTP